jgi:protein-tyrosine-phosphatase
MKRAVLLFISLIPILSCRPQAEFSKVVFVCEHGSVKSVIASEWFNRMAAEKQIPIRAVSLGVDPDENIPKPIYENLKKDGFELSGFKPKRFEESEITDAMMVVAIGIDEKSLINRKDLKIVNWSDIPPASTNYDASRNAIREHIKVLFEAIDTNKK